MKPLLASCVTLCVLLAGHLWAEPQLATDNALNVSWGDQIVVGKGIARLDTPDHIREALGLWQELGSIQTVYWRVSSFLIEEYHVHREKGYDWYYGPLREIKSRCDPRKEAIQACHDLGMTIYAYLTIYDEGSPESVLYGDNRPFPWQSRFTIDHPEFLVCDRAVDKRHYGVMEYWYPEVRQYKIGQILHLLDEYAFDGVYICTRTHSKPAESADLYGFNAPVREAFKERHGVDILTEPFDVQAWRYLRGEGLTLFFAELREALRNRPGKKIAAGIPRMDIVGPPYGNMTLHWRDWVRRGLVDEIVLDVYSGNFHYPSEKGRDRERGYLASGDEHFGLRPRLPDLRENYGLLCAEHGVKLRVQSSSPFAVPPLSGHMLNAMSFGNQRIRVTVAPHPVLDLQGDAFTVDFWVFPHEMEKYPRLLSKYDHTLGDLGRGWEVFLGDGGKLVVRFAGSGFDRHVESDVAIPCSKWTHIAFGRDDVSGKLFIDVNGVRSVQADVAFEGLRVVPVPLQIGSYCGGGRPFDGLLGGIRIWDKTVRFGPGGREPAGTVGRPLFQLRVTSGDGKPARIAGAGTGGGFRVLVVGEVSSNIAPGPGHGDASAMRFGGP